MGGADAYPRVVFRQGEPDGLRRVAVAVFLFKCARGPDLFIRLFSGAAEQRRNQNQSQRRRDPSFPGVFHVVGSFLRCGPNGPVSRFMYRGRIRGR